MSEIPTYPIARDPRHPLDPPPEYRRLRQTAPVSRVRVWDGSTPWLVTRYDDAVRALGDPRLSADNRLPGFPHTSAGSALRQDRVLPFPFREEAAYLAQRAMIVHEFAPKRIEALRPRIQRIVDDAIDVLLRGPKPADLMEAFALPVSTHVIGGLLGVPRQDRVLLHDLSRTIASRTAAPGQVMSALNDLEGYFYDLVRERLREPGDGPVGRLVTGHVRSGALSLEEAAAMVQLLFFAGHGPSAYMIGTGVAALFAHPGRVPEIRDPVLITGAVDELLRYVTVSHNGRQRAATDDVMIGGTLVRAGEGVLVQLDSANRDPSAFPEPDRLDFHRPRRRNLAFGYGAHHCMGRALAYLELQTAFATLFRRIPALRLAVPFEELAFKQHENALGLHTLPVIW